MENSGQLQLYVAVEPREFYKPRTPAGRLGNPVDNRTHTIFPQQKMSLHLESTLARSSALGSATGGKLARCS